MIKENKTTHTKVTAVFLFGKLSATLIIPAEIIRQCGLEDNVVIERKFGGIFIHKPGSEFETD
jgi:hypothetical protein